MIYDGADKAIREMNRKNLKAFGLLKLAKWDEVNVIREVGKVYNDSVKTAKTRYYEIGVEAYIVAMMETGVPGLTATKKADKAITRDWILDMLEESDPVTLYVFLTETDRKKQRLIEALAVAHDKNREIDKALKFWTMQVGQYADNTVFRARLQAYKDSGVERVRWVSQDDDRVCEQCDDLDGRVFPIDEVPPPQHWGCRCHLEIAK